MGGSSVKHRHEKYDAGAIESFAGMHVCVHLDDGTSHAGHLRTELLSERSLSVYIAGAGDEGATLYIDQITDIVPLSPARTT